MPSPRRALLRAAAPLAVVAVALAPACKSAPPPTPPPRPIVIDEDAPSPVTWAALHARGTQVRLPARPAVPLHLGEGMELVHYASGALSLLAVVARPPRTPLTADTPVERGPGLVLVHQGGALDDGTLTAAAPFVAAGIVVMLPSFRGENGNPGAPEAFFGEVDDAKAAARFLAEEPDVDVDHLSVFGDGHVTAQLALDPDCPFRLIGAAALPDAADYRALGVTTVPERAARAFPPHAQEAAKDWLLVGVDAAAFAARVVKASQPALLSASFRFGP